jgi:hypothetical protein
MLENYDTERLHSNHPLPVLLPRRPRNKSRTSQTAMMGITTSVRSEKIPCLVAACVPSGGGALFV